MQQNSKTDKTKQSLLVRLFNRIFRGKNSSANTSQKRENHYEPAANRVRQVHKACLEEIAKRETNQLWAMIMFKQFVIDSQKGTQLLEGANAKYLQGQLIEALVDLEAAHQEFSKLHSQLKQVYAKVESH